MHALVQDTVPENGVQRHYLFFFTSEASKLSTNIKYWRCAPACSDSFRIRATPPRSTRYSVYLLYQYKSTNTDTWGALRRPSRVVTLVPHFPIFVVYLHISTEVQILTPEALRRPSHVYTCTEVLVQILIVQKYLLTSTKVQILTAEELSDAHRTFINTCSEWFNKWFLKPRGKGQENPWGYCDYLAHSK